MVGFQQIAANCSQVKAAQPTLQGAGAHLQGHKIGRQWLEELLQALTAGKRAVQLDHRRAEDLLELLLFMGPIVRDGEPMRTRLCSFLDGGCVVEAAVEVLDRHWCRALHAVRFQGLLVLFLLALQTAC